MRARACALASLLLLLMLLGCTSSEPEQREVELKMYEVRVKPLSENAMPEILWERYSSAPRTESVVFNGYRISYQILFNGYEYKAPSGEVYTVKMAKYEGGRAVSTGKRGKILVLKMNFERVDERGIEPPRVTKVSPLLSLLLVGGLAPVEKEVVLTEVTTYLGLGDSYTNQWKYAVGSETARLCSFDTNSTLAKGFGVCMFTYPEDKAPQEIIVSLSGIKEPGYVIARIPI